MLGIDSEVGGERVVLEFLGWWRDSWALGVCVFGGEVYVGRGRGRFFWGWWGRMGWGVGIYLGCVFFGEVKGLGKWEGGLGVGDGEERRKEVVG